MEYYNKAAECMSLSEKEALQSERLVVLVKKVYENVGYYREKMDAIKLRPSDIKSISDIAKLPFTTKQDLRNSYPYGSFAVPMSDIVRLHASSGTKGKLTVAGYTKNDLNMWAEVMARGLVSAGATKESVIHISYGYGLFTGGLGAHYGAEKLGAVTVPVSAGNTARQLQLLVDFGADILCCTPSYALFLAEEAEKQGIMDKIKLKYGLFGAEPWSQKMRKEIEEKLHIRATDIYGLSEICGPGVATECLYQDGAHIQDDNFYPEIVAEDTLMPQNYGEKGELVLTTLTKEGMPLIRYRTRDITLLDNSPCECGRTSVRLKRVEGRSDDMMIIRGVNVFPSQIESVLSKEKEVGSQYQITLDRKNNLDTMQIEIELAQGVAPDEISVYENLKRRLSQNIASAIGVSANIVLVSTGSLKRFESKSVHITDNRKY